MRSTSAKVPQNHAVDRPACRQLLLVSATIILRIAHPHTPSVSRNRLLLRPKLPATLSTVLPMSCPTMPTQRPMTPSAGTPAVAPADGGNQSPLVSRKISSQALSSGTPGSSKLRVNYRLVKHRSEWHWARKSSMKRTAFVAPKRPSTDALTASLAAVPSIHAHLRRHVLALRRRAYKIQRKRSRRRLKELVETSIVTSRTRSSTEKPIISRTRNTQKKSRTTAAASLSTQSDTPLAAPTFLELRSASSPPTCPDSNSQLWRDDAGIAYRIHCDVGNLYPSYNNITNHGGGFSQCFSECSKTSKCAGFAYVGEKGGVCRLKEFMPRHQYFVKDDASYISYSKL